MKDRIMDHRHRLQSQALFQTLVLNLVVSCLGTRSHGVWNMMPSKSTSGELQPSARSGAAVWLNKSSGIVWMFGGHGSLQNESSVVNGLSEIGTLGDLWTLDLSKEKWTPVEFTGQTKPHGRHHGVACGNAGSIIVTGGVGETGFPLNDIWKFDLHSNSWKLETGFEQLLENVTHFWCVDNNLIGIYQLGCTSHLLNYHWENQTWNRIPSRVGTDTVSSTPVPDLRNVSTYPVWASPGGFALVYAPVKNKKSAIDIADDRCIIWRRDRNGEWKPIFNDCALHRNCSKLLRWNRPTAVSGGELPLCRMHAATWHDHNHNLWLYGGLSGDRALHDTWTFNLTTRTWLKLDTTCKQSLHARCQDSPGDVVDAMTWLWNGTLYLLGGRRLSISNVTYLRDLWTMALPNFSNHFALAVPPVGIFLITLSATCIMSLGTCIIIILVKCSSPLAPRIRPPVRTYGQVHYSPVNVDEVS